MQASFNPSYTGYATGSRSLSFLAIHPLPVSILLILDVLLEDWALSPHAYRGRSFNPSYTGCATGRSPTLIRSTHWTRFNPSYTGCATGRKCPKMLSTLGGQVSILLILDVLLEDYPGTRWLMGRSKRFNPSYTGCATGS